MKLVTPLKLFLEKKSNRYLNHFKDYFIQSKFENEKSLDNVIVSLTSFPARIGEVWKTIISIKSQTFRPEKIILWLSKEEFEKEEVPEELKRLQDGFFDIRWVDGNIRSHKKYYYAFKEFTDKIVITMDDDVYYHPDTIKFLYQTHLQKPDSIIANRVRVIKEKKGEVLPYNKWKAEMINKRDKNLFFIGVDGVLYPHGDYRDQALNREMFMKLTPLADDVWLNGIIRHKGLGVVYTGFKYKNLPIASETPSLESKNCDQGGNDFQLKNMREYFIKNFKQDIGL